MTDYTKEEKSVVNTKDFDFDYWCKLAKENPDVFETVRKQEIENHISTLGDARTQERLSKLQWRIEMERARAKNPMDAAIRIYDMMWESVGKNFELIQELAEQFQPRNARTASIETKRPQAKVLQFNKEDKTGVVG